MTVTLVGTSAFTRVFAAILAPSPTVIRLKDDGERPVNGHPEPPTSGRCVPDTIRDVLASVLEGPYVLAQTRA